MKTDSLYPIVLIGFTNWDKIAIKGPMTLQDLLNYFVKQYQVNLQILSVGKTCIFNCYSEEGKSERLASDIASIFEKISKETIPKSKKFLEITASGEFIGEGVDVIMPAIKYQIKWLFLKQTDNNEGFFLEWSLSVFMKVWWGKI